MITIKNFLTCKASDTNSRRHAFSTTTQTHTFTQNWHVLADSHTVSLLAKRKGGWEDEKEEAEVLSVFGCLYVQKHVWKSINGGYVLLAVHVLASVVSPLKQALLIAKRTK